MGRARDRADATDDPGLAHQPSINDCAVVWNTEVFICTPGLSLHNESRAENCNTKIHFRGCAGHGTVAILPCASATRSKNSEVWGNHVR